RLGKGFRIVLRSVAEPLGVRIIIPGASVVGDAVDDLEADVGMLKADAHQLGIIAWADPNRKPALIDRLQPEIADAGAQKTDPVLVGIEARKRLGEGLADAVAAVRAWHHAMVDRLVARIKADRVVARGDDDALDPRSSCCLEHVECAADVRLKDRLPAAFA